MDLYTFTLILFSFIIFCDKIQTREIPSHCEDTSDPSGFPGGIIKEFLGLVINGTMSTVFGCPENLKFTNEDIDYNLYNRQNMNESIIFTSNRSSDLDPTKPTIVIIPGWLCDIYNVQTQELIQAYLKRYDCNVLGISHKKLSFDLYSNAVCNIEQGAYLTATLLCELVASIGLDLSTLHLVGHSLGAQISGNVGYHVQKICNKKIDRISALDPAGPIFQALGTSRRLDRTDATFVDVIHSNMGIAGYYGTLGHVDFFPNCGTIQPGCLQIGRNFSIADVTGLPVNAILCSHSRAMEFFLKSVKQPQPEFKATSCSQCPDTLSGGKCVPDGKNPTYNIMGEDCLRNTTDSKFVLFTTL